MCVNTVCRAADVQTGGDVLQGSRDTMPESLQKEKATQSTRAQNISIENGEQSLQRLQLIRLLSSVLHQTKLNY